MNHEVGPSVRISLAVTLVAGGAFVVLAALLVPWDWLPGGHLAKVSADEVFTPSQITRGEHVSGLLRHAAWGNIVVGVLVAGILGFTRLGSALVRRIPGGWPVKVVLGCLAVSAVGAVAALHHRFKCRAREGGQGARLVLLRAGERLESVAWAGQ